MLNHVRPMVIKNKNKIKFFKMGYKFGGEAMHNIEGTLRSLAFLIQGRFKDSEFVAQSRKFFLQLDFIITGQSSLCT